MKNNKYLSGLVCLFIFLSLLSGCSINTVKKDVKKQEELNMQEKINPISDFEKLHQKKLPELKENQPAEKVSKIYFYEIENLLGSDIIIIDLQNKVAQVNPLTAHLYGEQDIAEFDISLSDEDVGTVVNILKDGNVEKWDRRYTYGDEDMLEEMNGEGYNWALFIQYKDGTMSVNSGKGVSKKEIEPDGYETFVRELRNFISSKENQHPQ